MYDVKISYSEGTYTFKVGRDGQTSEFTMTAKAFEANGFALSGLLKEHHERLATKSAATAGVDISKKPTAEVPVTVTKVAPFKPVEGTAT